MSEETGERRPSGRAAPIRESGARLLRANAGDAPVAAACQRPRRRGHGTLGSRVLTRPEDRSLAPVPNRWQPSADARCAILRRPGVVPARPRAELDDVLAGDERKKIDRARIHGEHWPAKLQLELIGDELDVLVDIETVRFVLRRTNADLE